MLLNRRIHITIIYMKVYTKFVVLGAIAAALGFAATAMMLTPAKAMWPVPVAPGQETTFPGDAKNFAGQQPTSPGDAKTDSG
jgi:hypothetical protein